MSAALDRALQVPSPLAQELAQGMCSRPHDALGAHAAVIDGREGVIVRVLHPAARAAWLVLLDEAGAVVGEPLPMRALETPHVFAAFVPGARLALVYRVRLGFDGDHVEERGDPYRHWPTLGDHDLHLFNEGQHFGLWRVLGAHPRVHEGDAGVAFAVWAPNAQRVSVVGEFCGWDGRVFPMRALGSSGVFELFVPGVDPGALYQFEIITRDGQRLLKADPFAQHCERPPGRASRVTRTSYAWRDQRWMRERSQHDARRRPLHAYEVHLGSWRRHADGRSYSYRELALPLVHHALHYGYTHVELLPVCEHPFEGSWGYQVTGYFAPTSRMGDPDDFRYFVDVCHAHGIGVIVDWVPAHFPRDAFALGRFDGTPLFEHADPLRGEHPDWGTYVFNFGRREVRNFLIASALYWLNELHVDGLRVDAVASMLYRDYSRGPGQWRPNEHGGREDLEAVAFLRALHVALAEHAPGAFTIAEESTSWPGVTAHVDQGGLGFTFKWNMGWMHDTLRYFARDPIHRQHHQDDLTFAILYEHSEHFVNALSHDEVVHGKGSLLRKMAGDPWQKLANLRALLGYQVLRPGKKLTFMGAELAMEREWDHDGALPAIAPGDHARQGFGRFVAELGACYRDYPCLWNSAPELASFRWIDTRDHGQSVLSFMRQDDHALLIVVLNLTPVARHDYRIGVPRAGRYRVVLNSDDARFGGSDQARAQSHVTEPLGMHDLPDSLRLVLPPLSVLVLEAARDQPSQRLHDVADAQGVFRDFHTIDGAHHVTDDATRAAMLHALGVEPMALEARTACVPATRVVEQGDLALAWIAVRTPRNDVARVSCALHVSTEDHQRWSDVFEYIAPARYAHLHAERLASLPIGSHTLRLELSWQFDDGSHAHSHASQTLIVAPRRAVCLRDRTDEAQARGLWLALYALRSARSWGIGDLSDLRHLVTWSAARGLDFVGINPLHASTLPAPSVSPYFPTTRLYRCELYVDVEAIPELSDCAEARALIAEPAFQAKLTALRASTPIDYVTVHALKWPVIERLAQHFLAQHKDRDDVRGRAYARYCRAHGPMLHAYATYRVLARVHGDANAHCWPAPYRDPHSAQVKAFADAHAEAIETHMFVQFELDRQLEQVAEAARAGGMAVGLYLDLAVGVQHGGFDVWWQPALFARDVNLGAPPDALGPEGQDWGLCPLSPHAQEVDGYRFVRTLLRHNMQHAGALRIDHALGLSRQYWLPHANAARGTYVAFALRHWLAAIAIESAAHRCLVIGEDLGTVPAGLRAQLHAHGIYGCRVLHFAIDSEHGDDGDTRTAVLMSLNSHDLPPWRAFVQGDDLRLRQRLGLLSEEQVTRAREQRDARLAAWSHQLVDRGLLPERDVGDAHALMVATQRALLVSQAELVALSLDDLLGETAPLNVPGVTASDVYAPWTRRSGVTLEQLTHDPRLDETLRALLSPMRVRR